MIKLKLPYPPSINHYYKNGRNGIKYIGERGQQYRLEVLSIVKNAKINSFGDSPVAVTVFLHQKDRRKRDIDNFQKCFFDALTHAGVWNDDSQIYELSIKKGNKFGAWVDPNGSGYCDVLIEKMGD